MAKKTTYEELEQRVKELEEEVTKRKLVEKTLCESEASYRRLAWNLPGIVYRVFLRENNRIHFINDMAHEMTGYKVDELKSGEVCSIEPCIFPEDWADIVATRKNAVMEDKPFEIEYRYRHKDGSIRYFF